MATGHAYAWQKSRATLCCFPRLPLLECAQARVALDVSKLCKHLIIASPLPQHTWELTCFLRAHYRYYSVVPGRSTATRSTRADNTCASCLGSVFVNGLNHPPQTAKQQHAGRLASTAFLQQCMHALRFFYPPLWQSKSITYKAIDVKLRLKDPHHVPAGTLINRHLSCVHQSRRPCYSRSEPAAPLHSILENERGVVKDTDEPLNCSLTAKLIKGELRYFVVFGAPCAQLWDDMMALPKQSVQSLLRSRRSHTAALQCQNKPA